MWRRRFRRLKRLAIFAGAGLPFFLVATLSEGKWLAIACGITGALLFLPGFVYLYVLTIWHWKDRYRGKHSDLWGALLLLETSGWFKIVYLFRHLLPDALESGRSVESQPLTNGKTLP
jgi:hypothetical protein